MSKSVEEKTYSDEDVERLFLQAKMLSDRCEDQVRRIQILLRKSQEDLQVARATLELIALRTGTGGGVH
jgi:hypothetical protein